ncbi:MAG: hypothetical protein ABI142_07750, partial [Bryocella sp.]
GTTQATPQQDSAAQPLVLHVFYQNATKQQEKTTAILRDTPGTLGADAAKVSGFHISQGLLGTFEAIVFHGGLE